jgi:hypothetical protein
MSSESVKTNLEQPREWLPTAPLRKFLKAHPDLLNKFPERQGRYLKSETAVYDWIEFATLDRALLRSRYMIEDVYGHDYENLIVENPTPPRKQR